MQIQINTDTHIEGTEDFADYVKGVVQHTLGHLSHHVTRVEVHLSDENGDKGGNHDKRCMMEARVEGRQPTAVSDEATTLSDAVNGAAVKLKHSLESTLARLSDVRR